jgi:hypothetical protein
LSAADKQERRDGFLARWSRRKREEAAEAQQKAVAPEAETEAGAEEPEDAFDLSLLPEIDSITAESDITLFFRKGVPDALKNAALRKIWTADASIRDFVAPADFQWDFNAPDGVPGFGPLGTEFDMTSMLRQAVGESEPEAASVAQPPSSAARLAEAGDEVPGSESSPANVADRPSDAVPSSSGQASDEVSVSQESRSENANFEIEADSDPKLPVLARKHGGALPT